MSGTAESRKKIIDPFMTISDKYYQHKCKNIRTQIHAHIVGSSN